jgi:hypothetical protein
MPTQLGLLEDPLELAFQEWIVKNAHVLEHLRRLAIEWHRAGHDRCAIAMLVEVARWRDGLRSQGDPWAINNSFRSRLARVILATTPELPRKFFAMRSLRTEWADQREERDQ